MSKRRLVIVGSGIAGLWTALHAAPRKVVVLSASELADGPATAWAQGGIAAALGEGDSPEQHALDTIAAGDGLVDEHVARRITQLGPAEVRALEQLGVGFDHEPDGRWALSLEAAHSRRRVARVSGDRAGAAILEVLTAAVAAAKHVEVREHAPVQGLMGDGQGRCGGVWVGTEPENPEALAASAVVLATGGLGGLYALTTNPTGNRGRALAWAARLGAVIRDAEFVQFHPTAIASDRNPTWLATEALRGEGAVLIDDNGWRFMPDIHPDAELAPRDIVARAVFKQRQTGRGAWLDARQAIGERFPDSFPSVFQACRNLGIDPRREAIPVAPAAHYQIGGIDTDLDGKTAVSGLFAVGECACIGLHGANRLASNSLLEALVMGRRVAMAAGEHECDKLSASGGIKPAVRLPDDALDQLRRSMTAHAGVEREAAGLDQLVDEIDWMIARHGQADELVAARIITRSASRRRESRGAHFRRDYPDPAEPARSTYLDFSSAMLNDH